MYKEFKNKQSSSLDLPEIHSKYKPPKKYPKKLSEYNLIDFSMERKRVSQLAPYHKSNRTLKSSILSSKVDFFDPKNQHRLYISRQKSLRDRIYSYQDYKKPDIQIIRKSKNSISPQLHLLLDKFLAQRHKSTLNQPNYYAVGHTVVENNQIFQNNFHQFIKLKKD